MNRRMVIGMGVGILAGLATLVPRRAAAQLPESVIEHDAVSALPPGTYKCVLDIESERDYLWVHYHSADGKVLGSLRLYLPAKVA